MIKLKNILKEDNVEDNFGKVAFGGNKKMANLQGSIVEPDTDFEKELIDALKQWTTGSPIDAAERLYPLHTMLKKAADKYPKVLRPTTPDGTLLYRGLGLVNEKMESKLKKIPKNKWKEIRLDYKTFWKCPEPVNYTPASKIQSWSTSKSVATRFASEGFLITKQNDEFLFNQKLLQILYQGRVSEQETLHFGQSYKDSVYIHVSDAFFFNLYGDESL